MSRLSLFTDMLLRSPPSSAKCTLQFVIFLPWAQFVGLAYWPHLTGRWLALVLHDCSSAANSDQARPNVSLPDTGAVGVLPLFTPSADSRIWASQVVLLMLLNGRGPFLT